MSHLPHLVISQSDYDRLCAMLDNLPSNEATQRLEAEIERAEKRPPQDMPSDRVSMRSRVRFTLLSSAKTRTHTLVYPRELKADTDQLSVLTPVGTALLGLAVGDEIDWPTTSGKQTRVRIDAIEYQPENAGAFNL